jgi:hypothetical protein
MKAPLLIVLGTVVLVAGSGLAIMNNACKSSHHAWSAPVSGRAHDGTPYGPYAVYGCWLIFRLCLLPFFPTVISCGT